MVISDFKKAVEKASDISRDDLATYMCMSGWEPQNEVGRAFLFETNSEYIQFFLGTCSHDSCILRDLTKLIEVENTFLDEDHGDVIEFIDDIKVAIASVPTFDLTYAHCR